MELGGLGLSTPVQTRDSCAQVAAIQSHDLYRYKHKARLVFVCRYGWEEEEAGEESLLTCHSTIPAAADGRAARLLKTLMMRSLAASSSAASSVVSSGFQHTSQAADLIPPQQVVLARNFTMKLQKIVLRENHIILLNSGQEDFYRLLAQFF
jgi:hypothetical protein